MCIFCGCNFQFHFNVKDLRQIWKLNLSHRYISLLVFPGGTAVKNPPAMQETQEILVRSLAREDPWSRKWQPIPVFLPGKSCGQRSLVGYSPWHCKRVRHDWATKHAYLIAILFISIYLDAVNQQIFIEHLQIKICVEWLSATDFPRKCCDIFLSGEILTVLVANFGSQLSFPQMVLDDLDKIMV